MKNTCKRLGVRWPTQRERQRLREEQAAGGLEEFMLGRPEGERTEASGSDALPFPGQDFQEEKDMEDMAMTETTNEGPISDVPGRGLPLRTTEMVAVGGWASSSGVVAPNEPPTLGMGEHWRGKIDREMQGGEHVAESVWSRDKERGFEVRERWGDCERSGWGEAAGSGRWYGMGESLGAMPECRGNHWEWNEGGLDDQGMSMGFSAP
eukprot:759457-Hanusia_phi.AAC.4